MILKNKKFIISAAGDGIGFTNSKLISKRQISTLMSRGIYNEGHSRGDLNKQTWLFYRGAFWNFDPYGNQTVFPGSNSPSALNSFFFCIK